MLALILGICGCFGIRAEHNTSCARPVGDSVILNNLDTMENRVLTVNRIIIIGNKVTKERIISRELSLKTGDTISSRRLQPILTRDKNKVYNLRLFNTVTIRVLELSANTIDFLIEVDERWYTFPAPIFELSDRNFNEWYQNYHHDFNRVNYGLRLYQYNFRGRNETLRLTAQFGFSRRFDLNYQIPYINRNQKAGLAFNVDYIEPRNLAVYTQDHKLVYLQLSEVLKKSFGFGITYNYRKSFYESHSISLGYRSTWIADPVVDTSAAHHVDYFRNATSRQQYAGITYIFNSDHRDVILYPLKGYQLNAYVAYAGIGSSSVNLFEINLAQARHWDLKRKFYLSNFTSAYLSSPSAQPYAQFSALGYRRQLVRGYEIYVIEGPKYILNKMTLKKRIFFRAWRWDDFPIEQFRHVPFAVYLKGYLDVGYVENYPRYRELGYNTALTDHMLAGAGGGLDIVTVYDLVFRLEYTFTRDGKEGFFFNLKKEF